jgi:oligogalacturonide lyase
MQHRTLLIATAVLMASAFIATPAQAQMGRRFPSEKKIVIDPVTGVPLTFLTSKPAGDSKIYQTHPQWTSDGKWVIFRSRRAPGQAFAVNEDTGVIVQVTESGYMGMLCVARLSMKLYLMRDLGRRPDWEGPPPPPPEAFGSAAQQGGGPNMPPAAASNAAQPPMPPGPPDAPGAGRGRFGPRGPFEIVEVDLAQLFADSEAGTMKSASNYERVCGTIPKELIAGGDMALDANEDFAYFRVSGGDVGQHLPPGTKIEAEYGPRHMGAGPAGLRSMNLRTGEVKFVVDVPFQIGHVQTNPWVPGEIVFCWETGGKAPQRTWTVMADGSGLRPLYPEASYDWVTHEAVITKDEVAIAIMGHRKVGTNDVWGACGTREHATGLGIVNLRTREMRIVAQTASGSGLWHVNGSPDGRWAVGDDFSRSVFLIDRHTSEMLLLSTGHKVNAADHVHPTFSADSTKIEIESAMLSPDEPARDGRPASLPMNICIIPVPKTWLNRTYSDHAAE